MYNDLHRNNQYDIDVILESYVMTFYEGTKYESLNESEKAKFADQIVTKLFKDIKKKTLTADNSDISKTKGDFSQHKSYKTIGRALRFLEASSREHNNADLSERVKVIDEAYKQVVANKDVFKNAFQLGNDVLIISYCNICTGIIVATSEAISLSTQLVQHAKIGVGKRNAGYKSNYIEGLKEANKLMKSGKLRSINDRIVVKNEAFMDNVKGFVASHSGSFGALFGVGLVILLLSSLKRICFTYYRSRVKMADHCRNVADYVTMKSEGISDKNVKAKQQKWIDRLMAFADKVDVDGKSANAKAADDIAVADQEMASLPSTWIM